MSLTVQDVLNLNPCGPYSTTEAVQNLFGVGVSTIDAAGVWATNIPVEDKVWLLFKSGLLTNTFIYDNCQDQQGDSGPWDKYYRLTIGRYTNNPETFDSPKYARTLFGSQFTESEQITLIGLAISRLGV